MRRRARQRGGGALARKASVLLLIAASRHEIPQNCLGPGAIGGHTRRWVWLTQRLLLGRHACPSERVEQSGVYPEHAHQYGDHRDDCGDLEAITEHAQAGPELR